MKNIENIKNNKKGFALVWALLMSMIILIMASSMVILVVKELRITSNIDQSNRAYLAAEAGIERGMYYIKNQGFNFCSDYDSGDQDLETGVLKYRYVITSVPSATGCESITIESTGTENSSTYRKLKLSIVYGPSNNIERYDTEPLWIDASRKYYPFPASSIASNKPLIIQQYDIWDIGLMSVGQEIVVGLNSSSIDNDFGTKITKINGGLANLSLTGRIGGLTLSSNSQDFSISGNPKFRVVMEYSRISSNYSVARSIVLLRDAASGEEKYKCPGSTRSYVVFGSVISKTPNITNVKVGDPSPSWSAPALGDGNGYLIYPGGTKIDNMVFWGRE